MTAWQVQQTFITAVAGSESLPKIIGIYTDGGAHEAVVPHLKACLRALQITGDIKVAGIPFYYLISNFSPLRPSLSIFKELFGKRKVQGPYCGPQERAKMLRSDKAKIQEVTKKGSSYEVYIAQSSNERLGMLSVGHLFCKRFERTKDGGLLAVVSARNDVDLVRVVRLLGNILVLRWDPQDQANQEFFGQPLI